MPAFFRLRNLFLLAVFLFFPGRIIRFAALFYLASDAAAWVWSRSLMKSISVSRTQSRLRINRHERLELALFVENKSRFPAVSCMFRDSSDIPGCADRDSRWLRTIPPGRKARLSYSILATERGSYSAGPVAVRCADPLGRYPFDIEIPAVCPVLVRPARIALDAAFSGGSPQGRLPVRNPAFEDSTQVRSARAYRAGDEIRRVNWKMSARLGALHTNEYLETRDCPVFVHLDLAYSRFPERHRSILAENLIELAAALVRFAQAKGQRCGFASQDCFIPAGSHTADAILDFLAVVSGVREDPYAEHPAPIPESGPVSGVERDRALLFRSLVSLPSGASFFFVAPSSPDRLVHDAPREYTGGMTAVWKWKFVRVSEYVYEKL